MEENEELIEIPIASLSPEEKLYVRAYLSTMSHSKAYSIVYPHFKQFPSDNKFSKRHNVQYHISLGLQEKIEGLEISKEKIIEKLYKEATREDTSGNARVSALNLLGKHLGMFQEVKQKESITYNIINYLPPSSPVEQIEPIESNLVEPNPIESIEEDRDYVISNYSEIQIEYTDDEDLDPL